MVLQAGISGSVLQLLNGILFGVVAGTILAFPLARFIVAYFSTAFGSTRYYSGPQPIYSIPESKRKLGDYHDAYTGFLQISESHPQELLAYVSMMEVAARALQDRRMTDEAYELGKVALKDENDQHQLDNMYDAFTEGMSVT